MARSPVNLTPEEILAQNEETYDELISLIENSQGRFSPIIVACDGLALRQRIIDRYEAEAWQTEQIRSFRVRLGTDPSLSTALAALAQEKPDLATDGKAVVTVTGAELLLRVKLDPVAKQSELEQFFGYLQWTREGLRAFEYPVVLWVSPRILREMSRRAPDFWSWRKAVFRFAAEDGLSGAGSARSGVREQLLGAREEDKSLPSLAELLTEIEELESRDAANSGLATLYGRLGQVYAQRVRRGESRAELEGPKAIAAFRWAIDFYQAQESMNALATVLNRLAGFYESQSQFSEALQAGQSAVAAASRVGNQVGEMIGLRRIGNAERSLGNYQQAIARYQQSLGIARKIEDRKGEAAALGTLGNVYDSLGQYQRAIDFYQQRNEIAREIGDRGSEANSLGGLGNAYQALGQYQRAIDFHQQWLEIAREIGDRSGEASSLGNLGNAYQSLGHYQRAIDFYQQQNEIARQIGDRSSEASSLGNLGNAYRSLGQYQGAIDCHQQSLEIKRKIGDLGGEVASLGNLGNVYDSLGQYQRAIDFHQQQNEIAREIGDRWNEGASCFNMAEAQAKLDDYWAAKQNYEQAKVIYIELKLDHIVEQCDEALARLRR
jgi:tetratricopeptide (TPR) repeat protein